MFLSADESIALRGTFKLNLTSLLEVTPPQNGLPSPRVVWWSFSGPNVPSVTQHSPRLAVTPRAAQRDPKAEQAGLGFASF